LLSTLPISLKPKSLSKIRHSKIDQGGKGVAIAIVRGDVACPATVLRDWLDAAGIGTGPLFRPINKAGKVAATRLTDRSVANIVKAYAERCRVRRQHFFGPFLRAGSLTHQSSR
jgi:hypothetical protein